MQLVARTLFAGSGRRD